MRALRAAAVIARRDYIATVFTRTFLLFLVTPLLPLLVTGLIAALSPDGAGPGGGAPPIVVKGSAADLHLLTMARTRIAARMGHDWMPPLTAEQVPGAVRLSGPATAPTLAGPPTALKALKGRVGLLVDTARAMAGGAPTPVVVRLRELRVPVDRAADVRSLARGTQLGMFFLTAILAGMLISNLVEEKSSKVIEVLAAAAPVDAIFLGKLAGMLGVSLTGIAVWGTAGLVGGTLALPAGSVPAPAVGWPAFVALVVGYWALLYLLLGALYLGIGAQAGSVREVQTLGLPLTLGQLVFFALGQAAAGEVGGRVWWAAAAVPWSSPFAMVALAAEKPDLAVHLAGIGWQLLCLAVVVRVAAGLFRRTVLSGTAKSRKTGWLSYISSKRRRT